MLRALIEAGISPQLVLGTSVGAINGAVVAAQPDGTSVARLADLWRDLTGGDVFGGSVFTQTATLVRTRTHVHRHGPLRRLLRAQFADLRIEDLAIPFQCVAASIERASDHWFDRGSLVDAVLASSAVPGLLPAVHIDGEHFLDGGLVDSIPVGRAVELGARTIYVLQVGRVESPLRPPRQPLEVALVAFEVARRHRFIATMESLPAGVDVHVLPTGTDPLPFPDRRQFRYRDFSSVPAKIDAAYQASAAYLREHGLVAGEMQG